jgi:NlpC/P60 family
MTTAVAAKARAQGESVEQADLAAEGIDVKSFLVDTSLAHGLKVNFGAAITSGSIERSIEGANTITITVHDGRKEVLRSGMFGTNDNQKLPVIDVLVEGLWYRLASFRKEGLELTLEFEDRFVFFLRTHNTPMSASRAHTTRAEFIGRMVKQVKGLHYFCPELHKRQPIEGEHGVTGYTIDKKTGKKKPKTKKIPEKQRRAELAGGLLSATDLTFEGTPLNKSQLQICEEVLDTGSEMGANLKVLISSIMCIMQESGIKNSPGHGGVDVGPFDQNIHDGWPASNDVPADARAYFQHAIANDKKEPRYTLADLVQSVQHSGAGASYYAKHKEDAEEIVKEYGEKGIGASHEHQITKEYDFHRGPPDGPEKEDSWEASDRLAKEVNWRRFMRGSTFYFVQDSDLMKAKPYAEISEDDDGIEEINGVIDAGLPANEALVHCRATRWWAPPGSVIKVKRCGPFNGRWLVFKIKRDLFSEQTEVTIHQPEAAKPEKASEKITVGKSGSGETLINGSHIVSGETPRDRIVEAARWGLAHHSHFKYAEVRPMPKSLFQNSVVTDCSGFATLCYKGAGVRDPNRFGYNGSGNTVSLRAQGNRTNTPEPGDLVFYRSPEHVGVYIGEGKVIEFGGPGGPHEEPIHYREDLVEVRNYSLESVPWGKESQPEPRGQKSTPKTKQKEPPEFNLRAPLTEQEP